MRFKCRRFVSFWCLRIIATSVGFSSLGARTFGGVYPDWNPLPDGKSGSYKQDDFEFYAAF